MEYLLHLTKLYPDMMYIHQDSGLINVAYFKFNIDDAKGMSSFTTSGKGATSLGNFSLLIIERNVFCMLFYYRSIFYYVYSF